MLTPIVLLLGLAVATCVIAYVADNLGKKLGKKRISMWGLRPRQTATLLTMASGLGIMFFTLFVLLGLWGPLRHALLSYDRVRANSRVLTQQNLALQASLSRLDAQSRKLEKQANLSRRRANAAQQKVAAATGQLKDVRRDLKTAQAARSAAVQGEQTARRRAATAQQRFAEAQSRAREAQARLAGSQERLAQVESTLKTARSGLETTRTRLASARLNLNRTRIQLANTHRAVRTTQGIIRTTLKTVQNLTNKVYEQQANVAELQKRQEQQQERVATLRATRDVLEREIANLKPYRTVAEGLATGQVVISVEQVFAERRLPPRPTAAEARAALSALLADGKRVVSEVGAQTITLAPVTLDGGKTWLDQNQILELLVNHLQDFEVPVAVRLKSAFNHFAGETEIMGRMETIEVRTAFRRGEVIAATSVDGKQSDARIFNQLLTLVNEGEKVARERKVTPPLTPDNPHFYATGTNERIFVALRQIQAINGPAQVRLVAAADNSTVDPMNVRLEVVSLAGESQ